MDCGHAATITRDPARRSKRHADHRRRLRRQHPRAARRRGDDRQPGELHALPPLLAEAASATLEPRHVVVPLRMMCPRAELLLGAATALDEAARTVAVETRRRLVRSGLRAACARPRLRSAHDPIPGSPSTASASRTSPTRSPCATTSCASSRRPTRSSSRRAERHLTFVFVGAGYAGVEALAELSDLVRDALGYYPRLRGARQRWVLVDAAPDDPPRDPDPARRVRRPAAHWARDRHPRRDDARVRRRGRPRSPTAADRDAYPRLDGGRARPPATREPGLPLDERGRVRVDDILRVEGCGRLGARRLRPRAERRRRGTRTHRRASTPSARRGDWRRTCGGRRGRTAAGCSAWWRRWGATRGSATCSGPPPRLPRLVRDAHIPPLPAPARVAKAAGRHRLDRLALLPPRHRRAPARSDTRSASIEGGFGGTGLVAGVRWVVRGKDAGSARMDGCSDSGGRRIAPPSAARGTAPVSSNPPQLSLVRGTPA